MVEQRRLRKLVSTIAAQGCASILLKGYTASSHEGTRPIVGAAMRLAKARNAAVLAFLKPRLAARGVTVTITTKAVGAQSFAASNRSRAGQAANRRVVVFAR